MDTIPRNASGEQMDFPIWNPAIAAHIDVINDSTLINKSAKPTIAECFPIKILFIMNLLSC